MHAHHVDRLKATGITRASHDACPRLYAPPPQRRGPPWPRSPSFARGSYDLVHGPRPKRAAAGRLAARAARIPALYTPHCYPFAARRVGRLACALTVAERALARPHGGDDLRLRGRAPESRWLAVSGPPSGSTSFTTDRSLAARWSRIPRCWRCVRKGRWPPRSRFCAEAEASRCVSRRRSDGAARVPEARLAVVGDGPLRDKLHARAAELGLDREERFAFLPFEAPSARHLHATDVFVLSSAWEAFPIGVTSRHSRCGVPPGGDGRRRHARGRGRADRDPRDPTRPRCARRRARGSPRGHRAPRPARARVARPPCRTLRPRADGRGDGVAVRRRAGVQLL